jgi:RHS repeat-associated protein
VKNLYTKFVAFLLLVSLVIQPAGFVFAQEASPSIQSEPSIEGTSESDASVSQDLDNLSIPDESFPLDENNSSDGDQFLNSIDTETEPPPSEEDSLLSGGEDVDHYRNSFEINKFAQVDESSGALQYEIPLNIPPGRNGLQPNLSLTYSSKQPYEGSSVGYGWTLNIPYIETLNKRGADKMFNETYFSSSISGELASSTASSTIYMPKVEDGSFLKYEYVSNIWRMTDKNGTVYTFGTSSNSRQVVSGTSTIAKWMLEEVRDVNNNFITYQYESQYDDNHQIYPTKIKYTGNGTTDGPFEINFIRSTNNDFATSSSVGFQVLTKDRITEIQTKINGTLVNRYLLSYSSPISRNRALLSTISQTGYDESGASSTLPTYQFTYQDTDNPGWTMDTGWTVPEESPGDGLTYTNLADVNGDGLSDIVRSHAPNKEVYLNNGTNWDLVTSGKWTLPTTYFVDGSTDRGFRMADVNGDGLEDILYGETLLDRKTYINDGSQWVENSSWKPPVDFVISGGADYGSRIIDVNGDGLPDIMWADTATSSWTYLNTGNGWATSTSWNSPIKFIDASRFDNGLVFVDANADGLLDILSGADTQSANPRMYTNTGASLGWTSYTKIPGLSDTEYFIESHNDKGFRFSDVDSDGQSDILKSYKLLTTEDRYTKLNSGMSWYTDSNWTPIGLFAVGDQGNRLGEVNGDGMVDFVGHNAYTNDSKKIDLLKTITYPTGGNTQVEYKTAQQYKDGSGVLLNKVPYPVFTVSKITHNDALIGPSTWDYTYENGIFYATSTDIFNRKFPGFGIVTRTSADGSKIKTYFHNATSTATTTSLGQYDDHISKAGRPYRIEFLDSSDNKYNVSINKWDKTSLGNDSYYVFLSQTIDLTYDGDSDHKDKARSYTYDSLGNITLSTDWGEVTGSADGTFTDIGTDKFTTTITYASTTARVNVPYNDTTVDQSSNKVRESRFYYDTLALGSVTKGNLTKKDDWITSTTYASSTKTYNSTYGTVVSETDPRSKTTTYVYDPYNLYIASSTNPVSHVTQFYYDYSLGKPKQVIDPNGLVYQTVYDGLDRVTSEKIPDLATPSTLVTKASYTYTTNSVPNKIQKTDTLSSATSTDSYTYLDGLGRVIQTRTEYEGTNTYNILDTVYNSLGQKSRETLPYLASSTPFASSTVTNSLYINYTYDPLNRITQIGNNIGTTTNTYDDWKLTVTDPEGRYKDLYSDSRGNLIQVDEHNSGSTYTTTYDYNGNNRLTKITDSLSNIRNFTYDGLGRRLTAQDLHASTDGVFGTWTYGYDSAGNITSIIDAKSQNRTLTYDDASRLLTENYTGLAGTEITYTYDICTYGKPKVCSAVALNSATTTYTYNSNGGIATTTVRIDNADFSTGYTYDRQGNPTLIIYPDSSQVKYSHDEAGLLQSIAYKENGGTFFHIVRGVSFAPTGDVNIIRYGNYTSTIKTFDPTKIYRLTKIHTTNSSNPSIQLINYTYDKTGNIQSIDDDSTTGLGKNISYTYDHLNRLTLASTTAATSTPYRHSFSYNSIGNITGVATTTSTTTYSYSGTGYTNPHAVTSIGGTTLTYSMNGNQILYGKRYFTFDYRNRVTGTGLSGATSTYTYDDSDQRVKVIEGGITTYYPSKLYSKEGATSTKNVYLGDQLIATIEGGQTATTTSTVHHDHLGGTSIVTDSSANVVQTLDYYPYGQERISSGDNTTKRHYIGEMFDSSTGLNYLNARYLDSKHGRFVSQDPSFLEIGSDDFEEKYGRTLKMHLTDPQSLNSYSYANGNPVILKDPDGDIVPIILAVWGAVELGLSIYDVYNTADTIFDKNASLSEKVITGGLTVAGFALPGGGYSSGGRSAGKVIQEIYKGTNSAGKALMKGVENIDVLRVIKENYKFSSTVGRSGSTADAVIKELKTGEKVGGKFHSIKAQQQINRIHNILKRHGNELSSREKHVLRKIKNELKSALRTNTKVNN